MTDPTAKRLLARGPDGKPTHRYVRAAETNIALTFQRIRKQLKEAAQKPVNVKQLRAKVAK